MDFRLGSDGEGPHNLQKAPVAAQENATKRQILSLVGTLHHAIKVVRQGSLLECILQQHNCTRCTLLLDK